MDDIIKVFIAGIIGLLGVALGINLFKREEKPSKTITDYKKRKAEREKQMKEEKDETKNMSDSELASDLNDRLRKRRDNRD